MSQKQASSSSSLPFVPTVIYRLVTIHTTSPVLLRIRQGMIVAAAALVWAPPPDRPVGDLLKEADTVHTRGMFESEGGVKGGGVSVYLL